MTPASSRCETTAEVSTRAETGEGGLGLVNLRRRAEKLHGQLVDREPGHRRDTAHVAGTDQPLGHATSARRDFGTFATVGIVLSSPDNRGVGFIEIRPLRRRLRAGLTGPRCPDGAPRWPRRRVPLLRDAHHAPACLWPCDPRSVHDAVGRPLRPTSVHAGRAPAPESMPCTRSSDADPVHLGRPFWMDDPDLELDHHLHHLVLDPPGDDRVLATVVGDIAGRQLRRDRPLWEISVIEGLADSRIAVLLKMHHSIIDGVSAANIMGRLLDLEAEPAPRAPSKHRRAGHGRPKPDRTCSAAAWPVASPSLWCLPASYRRRPCGWRRHCGVSIVTGDGDAPFAKPFTAPRTSFNATVTARRSVAFTDVALTDVKAVKREFGVTVNDVVTAVVGGALRRYLEDRGELPERPLLAAVPVSVHDQTADRAGTTKVSVMFSTLATDEPDPVARLKAISSANARAKEIHEMVGADTLMRWAELSWLNALGVGCPPVLGSAPCRSPPRCAQPHPFERPRAAHSSVHGWRPSPGSLPLRAHHRRGGTQRHGALAGRSRGLRHHHLPGPRAESVGPRRGHPRRAQRARGNR